MQELARASPRIPPGTLLTVEPVSAEHRAALLGALSGLEASGLKVVVADQAGTTLDEGTRVASELTRMPPRDRGIDGRFGSARSECH